MKIKKIRVPYQPDYDEPTEVPYQSGYSIPVTPDYLPSDEDIKHLQKLVKEGRDAEAENFVNRAILSREEETLSPGLPTRDYLARALHKSILDRYPNLNEMKAIDKSSYLPDKAYLGLKELKEKLKLSNQIVNSMYDSSYVPIGSKSRVGEPGTVQIGIYNDSYLDDILHENAHAVDDIIANAKKGKWKEGSDELKAIQNFVKNNPKLKKLYDSPVKETTTNEDTSLKTKRRYSPIRRVPNFQDYNFKTGEFDSDTIESPIQKYKEVGGEHHIERPFSLENFKNFTKGGLEDIVRTDEKFSKLRKIIA